MRHPGLHSLARTVPRTAAVLATCLAAACARAADSVCTDARLVSVLPPVLEEASGVAASTRLPGVLWVHNDSEGSPALYALSRQGTLLAEIAVTGSDAQQDWEDIAVGPCAAGSCIYIGDIGDNFHRRDDRAILRLPEPDTADATAGPVERFPFRYPDGPRDAEALFVLPDTTVWIISKGRDGPVTLYRYPAPLRSGTTVALVAVQQLTPGLVQLPDFVTGASAAPDGSRIAVRTYSSLELYRFDRDTLVSVWPQPFPLEGLTEPQGEGVAMVADTLFLVSEAGPFAAPPPLSRLVCAVD
jgi:hypothetical protein